MVRKLFNNRIFIIGLAVCSGLLMVRSIAAPFLDEPDFADVEAPVFDPDAELGDEPDIVSAVTAEPAPAAEPEDELWRADQSVLSGQLTWDSHPRRDPFSGSSELLLVRGDTEPMVAPAGGLPRLQALVAGPDSQFAVLNDQIVREGDLIAGYQVTRIATDGVRIASWQESHWLAVADMEIEIQPAAEPLEAAFDEPADEMIDGPEPGG